MAGPMSLYSPRAFIASVKTWIHERNVVLPHGEYICTENLIDVYLILFLHRNLGGVLVVDKASEKISFVSLENSVGHLPHPKFLELKIKPPSTI